MGPSSSLQDHIPPNLPGTGDHGPTIKLPEAASLWKPGRHQWTGGAVAIWRLAPESFPSLAWPGPHGMLGAPSGTWGAWLHSCRIIHLGDREGTHEARSQLAWFEILWGQPHHLTRSVGGSRDSPAIRWSLGPGRTSKQYPAGPGPDLVAAKNKGWQNADLLLQDWKQRRLVTIGALEWGETRGRTGSVVAILISDKMSAPRSWILWNHTT